MIKWRRKQTLIGFAAFVLLAGLVAVPLWTIRLPLALALAALLAAGMRMRAEPGEAADFHPSAGGRERRLFLQTMNHYRHDWMNDLQVISGYAQLKKIDPLLQYMAKVRDKLASDSAISRLGIPSLISELYVWKTANPSLQLRVQLDPDVQLAEIPVPHALVGKLIVGVIQAFQDHALAGGEAGEPGMLRLSIEAEERTLTLDFEFTGKYEANALLAQLRKTIDGSNPGIETINDLREEEADVRLRIPFIA